MDLDIHVVVLVVWLSIGLSTSSVLDSSVGKRSLFQCGDKRCTYSNEVCRLYNTNGQLNSQCVLRHSIPSRAVHDGCPKLLGVGCQCFCNIHNCDHQTQAGHHSLTKCGHHICKHDDEICKHDVDKLGRLHSYCILEHEAVHHDPNPQFGCTTLPTEHHPCYCRNDVCNTNLYNNLYQQNQVQAQAHHQELLCGDHVCNGSHERCVIEENLDQHLHLRCEYHKDHHTPHCLPNLLSAGKRCFCDTRTCVDHTLISLVSGHKVTGLICADHDDHVCHANQVCEIFHEYNGHFRKHCVVRHTGSIECQQLPHFNKRCICTTQQCIFGQFTAPTTMSTSSTLTTAGKTAAATIQQTTVQTTTVQLTTSVATTDISSITVALTNTPMVQAASSIPTTTVVTAVTLSTNNTCTDDEDSNFSCVVYEMMYGLCDATTGTLFNIAQKRCQAFCGICAVSLPTQPTCIDHDARCSQFQFQICSSNVSQNFVISTCPKSCNKCAQYLASLNPPTTTAQPETKTTQLETTTAQPVTKTAVVCQDNHDTPGVDCTLLKATIAHFCANPYSNTICAKSCRHCSSVIQSAFG